MTTETETEDQPIAMCPQCGEQTLDVVDTGWRVITRYACQSCGYEHTIQHQSFPIYALGKFEDKR